VPKLQWTKRNIDKLPFTGKGQVDYFATELKGFVLRVGRDSKTFYVQVDVFDPGTDKYRTALGKIGRYGELPPERAHQKAPEIKQRLRAGKSAHDDSISRTDILPRQRRWRSAPLKRAAIKVWISSHAIGKSIAPSLVPA
jgi:Arm DNA-binding domain